MSSQPLKIILASDHAGFNLKNSVKAFLESKNYTVLDVGAHELVPEDDFPVYMTAAAMKVAEDLEGNTRAILFGGSGQGETMVANRFPGVRAAVWYGEVGGNANTNSAISSTSDLNVIKLSREHNDANVLSIGARFVTEEQTKKAVELWLETPFRGQEKYKRRNDLIDSIE